MSLDQFRQETREWLEANCPESLRDNAATKISDLTYGGRNPVFASEDAKVWMERMAEKGWTVPDWPTEYGGAGLNHDEVKVLHQELARIKASPALVGHSIWMIGPALLEFGSEEQKKKFLPEIAAGKQRWCQGYSEPGSGSDLASLRCKCEDMGDHFLINGSKTWTTDADKADWIFCLVRTSTEGKKQAGISFLLIDMTSEGVSTSPIELISGESDFCETFFDNVKVPKENLVGELNAGWTVAKQLLVHERSMMSNLQAFMPKPAKELKELALEYLETDADGQLTDSGKRRQIASLFIDQQAQAITVRRLGEEAKAGEFSMAGLMMKYSGTELDKKEAALAEEVLGNQGLGWEGEGFKEYEIDTTRHWLLSKGLSLGGGTSEIQLNVVAKHALGLPE